LRKNDQACESEANDFLQTLASFQQEFGQLTSVFDTNVNKSNHSAKTSEATQEPEAENQDPATTLKEMLKNYSTTKVVVNPEICQKIQSAESAALAKYMEQMQLRNQIARSSVAMKSYARPATPSSGRGSGVSKGPVSAGTRKRYDGNEDNTIMDETDAEIAAEIKEMKDRLIECGRERLKQKLQERRMAAMAAKENTERTRAQAILWREEAVENNVDKTKIDMQRKLRSRIEEKMQNRGESAPVADEKIGDDIVAADEETEGAELN
uniref:Pinin_SDK_memA domain-containing protein n=1 Tax=Hymenolepis diminuta TaxID=6216 RepID=A0A0R3SYW7_HYMDI